MKALVAQEEKKTHRLILRLSSSSVRGLWGEAAEKGGGKKKRSLIHAAPKEKD